MTISDETRNRGLNVMLAIWAVSAIALLGMVALNLQKSYTAESETSQIRQGNDLRTCRAVYRVAVDDANAVLVEAQVTLDILNSEALDATVAHDTAALTSALASMPQARTDAAIAADNMKSSTADYAAAVMKSRDDPQAFLAGCAGNP